MRFPTLAAGAHLLALLALAPPATADERLELYVPATPVHLPEPEDVQRALSLEELEQMALARNPTLAQAAARAEAVRGKWLQVGLKPNPQVGYSGEEIGNEGAAGLHSLFVSQEIVTGGKRQLSRLATQFEVERQEQLYAAQQQRVLTDVRRRFYEALVAQQSVQVSQNLVEISEKAVETAKTLLAGREVRRLDVLQAQVEANNARLLRVRAQTRHREAWRQLQAVVADPHLAMTRLHGDAEANLPRLDWQSALHRLLRESPQLAAAHAEVERARWHVDREVAGAKGNFQLEAGAGYDEASGDGFGSIRVAVPIPLHDANQGNIARANAELAAAQRDVERLELSLHQQLAAAFARYDEARRQFDLYNGRILPDTKASLTIIEAGYPTEFSYLNLIAAQREYFQAELGKLESLQTLRSEAAAIEGLLLQDSLQRPK